MITTGGETPRSLLRWLEGRRHELAGLLEELARAESPSLDAASQAGPFRILARELDALDYLVRAVPGRTTGAHLYARPRTRRRGEARQLLIGHMDTVWPLGTLTEMPIRRESDLLYGPGTADMKGGLVSIVFALRALRDLDLRLSVTPVVFVSTDEEIGSIDSTRVIRLLARGAERAFVLEAGEGPEGRLKIAREGLGRFVVTVRGRPAHAGSDPEHGISAVLELSHQIQRLFALNDPGRGVTVNVGTIDGGLRPNVVAPVATATVDVRAPTAAAADELERALRRLTPVLDGAAVEVEGGFHRPPMEPLPRNRTLLAAAIRLGHDLGIAVEDAGTAGGGSDANTTSLFAATLDGLGPAGGGSHARDEHVDLARLPERVALLALLLLEPVARARLAGRRTRVAAASSGTRRVAVVGSGGSDTNLELAAAWRALGLDARLARPRELGSWLRPDDIALGRLDVLPTIDGVETGLLELLQLERRGFAVLNTAGALAAAHDKALTARLLARAGLPHPRTAVLRPGERVPPLEPPVVVKPRHGSWGVDVFRCDTEEELHVRLSEIQARPWFRRRGALLQELVEPRGHDLRLVVAGGTVVGAVERIAAPGEWRTNVSLGGTRRATTAPPLACVLGVAAAAAIHADLVGVDLLPTSDGYTVLELNGAVDFNAGYAAPGRDVFEDAAVALGLLHPAASPTSPQRAGARVAAPA